MGLIEDIDKIGIDYSNLPPDCPAMASERLRKFFWGNNSRFTKDYTQGDYARDLDIVIGNPCKGVIIPSSHEDAKKLLEKIFSAD